VAWLEAHGHAWVKVEAEPGDLLLWDSRTPHYNVPAKGQQDRLAITRQSATARPTRCSGSGRYTMLC
jgi:hypothetical protein